MAAAINLVTLTNQVAVQHYLGYWNIVFSLQGFSQVGGKCSSNWGHIYKFQAIFISREFKFVCEI